MKKTTITLLLGLGLLAACGSTRSVEPMVASQTQSTVQHDAVNPALHGQAGEIEFALDEDVFTVERTRSIFFIALALYLPFLVI